MASTNLEFIISAIDKASGVFNGVGGAGEAMSNKLVTAANAIGAAYVSAKVVDFGHEAMNEASDLSETLNKASVVFGDNANEMKEWAEGGAEAFGLSTQSALAFSSTFGDMFTQLGFAGEKAASMSQDVVQLAGDLGSFHNLETEDVLERISGAMRGEYDSLQALIPNINAARVEQEALAMTGKKSASDLTAAEKAAATLAIIHRDGAAAANDFAETSNGLANQTKVTNAEFQNASAMLGEMLVPAMAWAADKAAELLKWMQDHETATKVIVGLVAGLALGYGVLTAAQTVAAGVSAIRALAMGTETAATVAGTAANTGFAVSMWAAMAPVLLIVAAIAAVIAVVVLLVKHWDKVKAAGAAAWEWIKGAWSSAGEFFSGIGNGISNGFKAAFNAVAGFWNGTVGKLSWDVPDWVPGIGGNTIAVPKIPMLATGGDVTRSGFALVGERGAEVVELPAGARVWPHGTGPAAAAGGGVSIAITNHYPVAEPTSVTTNRALDYAAALGMGV